MTILFKNQQWKVEKCGMSAIKRGYFIERARIEERRMSKPDLFSWPLQMADKGWVDLDAFCEAFTRALTFYKPDYDQDRLHRSIEEARLQKAESIKFSQVADKMFPNRRWMTACDLEAVGDAVRKEAVDNQEIQLLSYADFKGQGFDNMQGASHG